MKTSKIFIALLVVLTFITSTSAKLGEESNHHINLGVGLLANDLPVLDADVSIPLSHFSFDYSFMAPYKDVRASVEVGLYGFYGIIPVPELGANIYFGRESNAIQGKLGLSGYYDILLSEQAGMVIKPGIIINNLIDISLLIVPFASNSDETYSSNYYDQMGSSSSTPYLPYAGFMIGIRF